MRNLEETVMNHVVSDRLADLLLEAWETLKQDVQNAH